MRNMIAKIFKNIGAIVGAYPHGAPERLCGAEMDALPVLHDAYMTVFGDRITGIGPMSSFGDVATDGAAEIIDMQGEWVFPSFCDSHTHVVYAGNRVGEFVDKIHGLSYEEIAARGGGILNSADLLHETSEDDLYRQAMARVDEVMRKGTGAMEIKSGYGLRTDDELKMLRVIDRIRRTAPVTVKSTFLGAHAVGREYAGRIDDYVEMLCTEMLPEVGKQGLADYVDVFCDEGFFTPAHTACILEAAAKYGLKPKIHANELAVSGGVQVGVAHDAVSVDHLERAGAEEIEALRGSRTIPTMLPGASFFLGMPYGDARGMIAAGLPLALASDYNPGSSPSGDMRFVASLGCMRMRLTPEQALNAVTINGAAAMELQTSHGAIAPGMKASFFTTAPMPEVAYMLYAYTTPFISQIWLKGEKIF